MDVLLETDERVNELYNMLYHRVVIQTTVKVSPEFMFDPYFGYSSDKEYVSFVGYLKTVDPETKAAILLCIKDGVVLRSMLVMGHCIKSIVLYQEESHDNEMLIQQLSGINFDNQVTSSQGSSLVQPDRKDIVQTSHVEKLEEPQISPETIRNIVDKIDKVQLSRYDADNALDEVANSQISELKEAIKDWLVTNRIPVETRDGANDLIIANCVTLKPPYTDECNYICPNRIVLYRIKSIIDPFIEKVYEDRRSRDDSYKNIVV